MICSHVPVAKYEAICQIKYADIMQVIRQIINNLLFSLYLIISAKEATYSRKYIPLHQFKEFQSDNGLHYFIFYPNLNMHILKNLSIGIIRNIDSSSSRQP